MSDASTRPPSAQALAQLRGVTYRIASTQPKELPQAAAHIAGNIWNCRTVLSLSPEQTKSDGDLSVATHRFKTTLTSLLQDRSVEARWAAVVLVKTTIEAGGLETLSKSAVWIRSLCGILKKPDPPSTRALAVITLTRIFVLTWEHPALVRELTTPNLTAFVSNCINNIKNQRCSRTELESVLEAFATLVPRHPTIFRTQEAQLRSVLIRILASASSASEEAVFYTEKHCGLASRLLILLHHCAPKQGGAEKWQESLRACISAAHATCDLVFRSVVESWQPAGGSNRATQSALAPGVLATETQDAAGLPAWNGLQAGSQRLICLVKLALAHLQNATSGTVALNFGSILDIITRLLSVTVLQANQAGSAKINAQYPKDERDALFTFLPQVHVSTIELARAMVSRLGLLLGGSTLHVLQATLDHVFVAEMWDVAVRAEVYHFTRAALELLGPSMTKPEVADLTLVIRAACSDALLGVDGEDSAGAPGTTETVSDSKQRLATDTSLTRQSHLTEFADLQTLARCLLSASISKLNQAYLPAKVRAQIERTAALTRDKHTLLACVMSPAVKRDKMQTSLMPLLARECPDSLEVDLLLRPRMPPIQSKTTDRVDLDDEDEDEDENDVEDGPMIDSKNDVAMVEPVQDSVVAHTLPPDQTTFSGETPELQTSAQDSAASDSLTRCNGKRTAAEPSQAEDSAKRLRAGSDDDDDVGRADTIPQRVSDAHIADGAKADDQEAVSIPNTAVEPRLPTFLSDSGRPSVTDQAMGDDGSDGSDFELPPLTMDPDTDPEEEDDDE